MDMKLNIPILNNWAQFRDVLVGEAINHPDFRQGQRVHTNKVISEKSSFKDGFVFCTGDEQWQLGKPGNLEMYA